MIQGMYGIFIDNIELNLPYACTNGIILFPCPKSTLSQMIHKSKSALNIKKRQSSCTDAQE